jgi:Leucine-rich repeat (LRR) protein
MALPNIPELEIRAPLLPTQLAAEVPRDASVAAIFGHARDFTALLERQQLEKIWVSGGDENTYKVLGCLSRLRQLVIHNYRNESIKPLAQLTDLTSLAIAGSFKLKSLAGIEKLTNLRTLILFANCGYSEIGPLANLASLETLCLEGGMAKPLKIESLKPLENLRSLVTLRLASIRVKDKSLRSLHALVHLRKIFIADTFAADDLRSLAHALPLARGDFLDSHRTYDSQVSSN